ncbi:MAG: acetylornithine transaminase [Nitrospiraceae bacterium]|nr:acetylornithine transaminase [Nitrospiraceae bacterium]
MDIKKITEESGRYQMDTYTRQPLVLRKGRGVRVWSGDDREFLDFVGGIAVNVLGHCHPKVVVAVQKQVQRLIHVSNLYYTEAQVKLARLLIENSFAGRAFFCNSGAEANEAAIKLARKYAKEHSGPEKYRIITAINSFHGRTFGALSATGQPKFHAGFEPLLDGFIYVPYDDAGALREAVEHEKGKLCAVMLEPIQGEGGVRVPGQDYLKQVRDICGSAGALLIFDEVQTGIGRTGELFAYKHWGVKPDIMTLAKGLGGGMPIGAVLAREDVAEAFTPGSHASTFGGGPVVCAAGVAVLQVLLEDNHYMLGHAKRMGTYFREKLDALKVRFPDLIKDIRGMGLLIGMELSKPCAAIVAGCMEKGLLVNCTSGNVLRFLPPLIVQDADIDIAVNILDEVLAGEAR